MVRRSRLAATPRSRLGSAAGLRRPAFRRWRAVVQPTVITPPDAPDGRLGLVVSGYLAQRINACSRKSAGFSKCHSVFARDAVPELDLLKPKLDLHDVYNRGHDIDHALLEVIEEAVRTKAAVVEMIPGKGSG